MSATADAAAAAAAAAAMNATAAAAAAPSLVAMIDPDVAVDFAMESVLPAELPAPEALRAVLLWCYYYAFIHLLYYGVGGGGRVLIGAVKPDALTLRVRGDEARGQMQVSEMAFPLYCCVPVLGDVLRRHGVSRTCDTVEACGGPLRSAANFLVYMLVVEAWVYWVHMFLLHKWSWGKRNLKHDLHHAYKHDYEMTTWSGYAFEAVDGASQGLPFILTQCIVPIPHAFAVAIGAFTGMWTMYIHTGRDFPMPWPLMGCDYHHIHHVYNWYNFGLFTMFWDWAFGTLKHPDAGVDDFAERLAKKGTTLDELHQMAVKRAAIKARHQDAGGRRTKS